MKKLLLLSVVSALGLGLAGCGDEPVPDYPSYTLHVRPILTARCVRCHNPTVTSMPMVDADPDSPKPTIPGRPTTKETPISSLDTYESAKGSKALFGMNLLYLDYMPPPPSPPLTDREKEILARWLNDPRP